MLRSLKTYGCNYNHHSTKSIYDAMLGHLWTLGIEEQFYLAWPLFVWAIWRMRFRFHLVVGVTVLSFVSYALTLRSSFVLAWWMPWNRLWELALGGGIAFVQLNIASMENSASLRNGDRLVGWLKLGAERGASLIGALVLMISLGGLIPMEPGAAVLVSAAGSFLMIAAGRDRWMNRYVLGACPLVFAGLISYPLYLWHVPVFNIADILYARGHHYQILGRRLRTRS